MKKSMILRLYSPKSAPVNVYNKGLMGKKLFSLLNLKMETKNNRGWYKRVND